MDALRKVEGDVFGLKKIFFIVNAAEIWKEILIWHPAYLRSWTYIRH